VKSIIVLTLICGVTVLGFQNCVGPSRMAMILGTFEKASAGLVQTSRAPDANEMAAIRNAMFFHVSDFNRRISIVDLENRYKIFPKDTMPGAAGFFTSDSPDNIYLLDQLLLDMFGAQETVAPTFFDLYSMPCLPSQNCKGRGFHLLANLIAHENTHRLFFHQNLFSTLTGLDYRLENLPYAVMLNEMLAFGVSRSGWTPQKVYEHRRQFMDEYCMITGHRCFLEFCNRLNRGKTEKVFFCRSKPRIGTFFPKLKGREHSAYFPEEEYGF